jgi:serine/threonine-protein kinase
MLKHKLKGPPEFPPDRGGPSWLQRACLRGLQPKPEHRWASMDELLSTLERNLDGARRRMTLTAASAGLVVLGGLSVWTMAGAPEDPCKHAGEGIEQVWNLRRHQEVHDTLAALQRPYLDEIVPRLDGDLDAYASDWTRARVAACEANQDRSDHSPQMLDRAMACLDQRRDLLRATVDALAGAKEESVARKAVRAAMQLPPIDTCSDEAYLQTTLPPLVDPERAETAAEIRSGLADVRALGETGQVEAARELARDLARRAATLDYPPVDVEARARLGEALHDAGRFEESRDVLIPTYFDALEIGHDRQAASIASLLVFVVGKNLSRTEEARGWAQHADALLERFDDDGRARARFVLNLGSVALEAAEYDVALEHYRRALELHEKLFGEEDPRTAMVHSNIGIVLERHKQLDAAIEEYRRSIELYEASLGKDYPDLAMPLVNIGSALSSKGDFEAARVHLERALAIWEHSIGPDHPHVATVLNNIGTLLQDQGRNDEALGFHERALDIRTRVLGPEHPDVAMSLNNLGNIRRDQGDLAGSERDHRRALEIRSNALGEDHPLTATSAYNLGLTVLEQGKPEQAQALVERSIEIWRARLGPQHPYVAVGLQGLASIAIERGDLEQAQAHLQQSLAVLEQTMGREHFQVAETLTTLGKVELDQGNAAGAHAHLQRALQIAEGGTQPQLLARVAFALARTEAARGNLSVAKQRARQALSAYESVDDEDDARAAVERWLAEH